MSLVRIADAAELAAFLAAHPDVRAVQIMITDPSGVLRGKSVRREELVRIYASGRQVAGSILGLDITGEDVDATGLVWDTGDADMCARPIAGTLKRAPWLAAPTGQLMLTLFDGQGEPAAADPRHALVRVLERFAALGMRPVVACELEFYLLKDEGGGRLVPAGGGRPGERQKIDAYSLTRLDDLAPVFDEVYRAAQAQDLPAETLMSEYAPGQFEITLHHRDDALRAVDEAILFKRVMRGVAARHGLVASFMAKPFADRAGSGMHLHASLVDGAGRNLFAAVEPEGTAPLRHAIGGLRETMADGIAVFAPHANSYRRFRAQSYAPIAPTWGINNRTVSLRVPAGPPESRHVEHRVAGADANPYLVAALVLAGMLRGIDSQSDPGTPVTGNGYTQTVAARWPLHWPQAVERAANAEFVADALGRGFLDVFLAIKRHECEKFGALVSDRDYEWYLDTV